MAKFRIEFPLKAANVQKVTLLRMKADSYLKIITHTLRPKNL